MSPPGSRLVAAVLPLVALAECAGSGDAEVIDQLRAAGADLTQARQVRYYLYLPSQEQAHEVVDCVADGNRGIEVAPAATGRDWLVLVTEVVVVDASPWTPGARSSRALPQTPAGSTTDGRPRSTRKASASHRLALGQEDGIPERIAAHRWEGKCISGASVLVGAPGS